jgi:membrane associated rhomboid family serine protease
MCIVGPLFPSSASQTHDKSSSSNDFDQYKKDVKLDYVDIFGVYQPQLFQRTTRKIPLKTLHNRRFSIWNDDRNKLKGSLLSYFMFGYPSLIKLAERISFGKYQGQRVDVSNPSSLIFNESKRSWCFHLSNTEQEYCIMLEDEIKSAEDDLGIRIFPPSGIFQLDTMIRSNSVAEVFVNCPQGEFVQPVTFVLPSWLNPFHSKFRKNPSNVMIEPINTNLEFMQLPVTTFLITLNVLLAIVYWKNQTDPSSVCKEYKKIVLDQEFHRSFTGATAHFEPLHLGFNMMSLYALGSELELRYGSISFLFRNISLIPMTTMIMMALVWIQMRYTGNDQLKYTRTIGYSGVLFAWMVISSLERNSMCPIPFAPEICFNTHIFSVGSFDLKWNFGPMVQLVLAQVIMPRVSFIGHLAGIICGFIMHWNILWREIAWSPQVFIPLLLLIQSLRVRGSLFTYRRIALSETVMPTHHKMGTFFKIYLGTFLGMMLSFLVWEPFSSPIFNQILLVLLLHIAYKHANESLGSISDDDRLRIWKYTLITAILVIVTDAISFPYLLKTKNLIYFEKPVYSFPIVAAILLLRSFANIVALLYVSKQIRERYKNIHQCKPFEVIFGWTIEQGHQASLNFVRLLDGKISANSSFEGPGHILGSV